MLTTHNVPYALKCIRYVFKQQIRRSFCRSQPGNFKEQGTSWIGKSPTVSSNRKRLTGKTSAQEFEVGDIARIGFSDIFTEPLSFGIEQGFIALIGFLSISQCPTQVNPPARVSPSRNPPIPENRSIYRMVFYITPLILYDTKS